MRKPSVVLHWTCVFLFVSTIAHAEPCGPPAPAVQIASPVRGYDARDAHHVAWIACGVTALDLGSTELVIAKRGREFNPLIGNRAVRIGVGALGCYGLHEMAAHDPERARMWTLGAKIVRGLAVAWNVPQLAK